MAVEIDHIIIFVTHADRAAAKLRGCGLTEGSANVHPGQGTSCRRFFFRNAYIELLWVSDEAAARSEGVKATRLWERWAGGDDVCRFGVAFRPRGGEDGTVPFESWDYRPEYLPRGLGIAMATNTDVQNEPLLIYLSFAVRPDAQSGAKRQPLKHSIGVEEITRVCIAGPLGDTVSGALAATSGHNAIRIRQASVYGLEIGFDGENARQRVDLRPELPLVLAW